MTYVWGFFLFIFGLIFGSFLNVCIYRFPQEESIVKPGSRCPHCKKPIAWYDNIPLLSFLILAGRCRQCKAKISVRYFLVELASGLMWVLLWLHYGFSGWFVAGVLLISILLAVSMTDLETGYIPDDLTLPGMACGLVISAFFPELHGKAAWTSGILHSALGLLAGGGVIYVAGVLGNFFFRKESMGGGDVKLLAMVGTYLGMKESVLVFLLSPFVALPFALYLKFIKKSETIPYGPFLAMTAAWLFVYGDEISNLIWNF